MSQHLTPGLGPDRRAAARRRPRANATSRPTTRRRVAAGRRR